MASKPGAPRPAELTFGSPQHAKIVDCTAKLVVRGGVEPPTFRFSEGLASPGESTTGRLTRLDAVLGTLAPTVVPMYPQLLLALR